MGDDKLIMPASSRSVRWDTKTIDYFAIFGLRWSVRMAKRFLVQSPRPVEPLRVVEWRALSAFVVKLELSPKVKVDLTIPLIVIPYQLEHLSKNVKVTGRFIIDGWHRLQKADDAGIDELPSVHMTLAEARRLRMR